MDAVVDVFRWFTVDRAAVLVATGALAGVFFTWRQARSAREQANTAKDQAVSARDQADAAREQVEVMRDQTALLLRQVQQAEAIEIQRKVAELEALQPAVVVSVQQGRTDPSILVLVIENLGKTAARNVRITPSTKLIRSDGTKLHKWNIFSSPIQVMPAGQRFQYFFEVGHQIFGGNLPTAFSFTVEADGTSGALPPARYDIDLNALRDVWVGETTLRTLVQEIKRTTEGLGELKQAVRYLDPEYRSWVRRGMEELPSTTPDAGFP